MSDSENENEQEGEVRDINEVKKEIEERCQEAFNALDKDDTGHIASSDVKTLLEMMGIKEDEGGDLPVDLPSNSLFKMVSDLDPENNGTVAYSEIKTRIINREIARLGDNDDSELLDAYVSMGGDPDGGGCVDA